MYHKIMLWKIAGRADREREAAQKRAFNRPLSERRLGEKRETTRELECSSTRVDAGGVQGFVSTHKK